MKIDTFNGAAHREGGFRGQCGATIGMNFDYPVSCPIASVGIAKRNPVTMLLGWVVPNSLH